MAKKATRLADLSSSMRNESKPKNSASSDTTSKTWSNSSATSSGSTGKTTLASLSQQLRQGEKKGYSADSRTSSVPATTSYTSRTSDGGTFTTDKNGNARWNSAEEAQNYINNESSYLDKLYNAAISKTATQSDVNAFNKAQTQYNNDVQGYNDWMDKRGEASKAISLRNAGYTSGNVSENAAGMEAYYKDNPVQKLIDSAPDEETRQRRQDAATAIFLRNAGYTSGKIEENQSGLDKMNADINGTSSQNVEERFTEAGYDYSSPTLYDDIQKDIDNLNTRADRLQQVAGSAPGGKYSDALRTEAAANLKSTNEQIQQLMELQQLAYGNASTRSDFAARSGYTGNASDTVDYYALGNNASYDDYYNAINGDATAYARLNGNYNMTGINGLPGTTFLNYMTDDEKAIYNYYYNTGNVDYANEYLKSINESLEQRTSGEKSKKDIAYAQEHPVAASVGSIITAPMKSVGYIGQAAEYLGGELGTAVTGKGSGGTIDEYSPDLATSRQSEDITNTVAQNFGKFGQFAYSTGMSMAQFLTTTALTAGSEPLNLAIMGTEAAADSMLDAKERGLSDDQTFALSAVAGAAEIVTEKVSIDLLFDTLKAGKTATKKLVKKVIENFVAEGSEEGASDLINLTTDLLISGDKAEFRQDAEEYGVKQAIINQAKSIGTDMLAGGISGLLMGSGAAVAAYKSDVREQRVSDAMNSAAESLKAQQEAIAQKKAGISQNENVVPAAIQQDNRKAENIKTDISAEVAKTFGEAGQKAFPSVQENGKLSGLDDAAIYEGYAKAYNAGKNNEALPSTEISETAANAAYMAGREDANASKGVSANVNEEGSNSNGGELLRNSEFSTGESSSGIRQATETVKGKWATGEKPADNNAEILSFGKEVSGKEIGLDSAKADSKVYTVASGETQSMQEAQSIASEEDCTVNFFAGGNIETESGESARGFVSADGKTIGVRVDNTRFTSKQITQHEVYHVKKMRGKVNPSAQISAARESLGDNEGIIDLAIEIQREALPESYTDEDIMEELCANAAGAMNIVSAYAEENPELYQEYANLFGQALNAISAAQGNISASDAENAAISPTNAKLSGEINVRGQDVLWPRSKEEFVEQFTANGEQVLGTEKIHLTSSEQAAVASEIINGRGHLKSKTNAGYAIVNSKAYSFICLYDGEARITGVIDITKLNKYIGGIYERYIYENSGHNARQGNRGGSNNQSSNSNNRNLRGGVSKVSAGTSGSRNPGNGRRNFKADLKVIKNTVSAADAKKAIEEAYKESPDYGAYKSANAWLKDNGPKYVGDYIEDSYNAKNKVSSVGDLIARGFKGEDIVKAYQNKQLAGQKAKFSGEEPVEFGEKLVALHNLSEEKLLKTLDLEGFPMISIAVTRSDISHSNYGDITLMFPRSTIDPTANRNNAVYGSDAWTPTFPSVEYPVDADKMNAFDDKIKNLSSKIADGMFDGNGSIDSIISRHTSEYTAEELSEKLARRETVKAAYLADKGQSLKPVMKKEAPQYHRWGNDVLRAIINDIGEDNLIDMYWNEGAKKYEDTKSFLDSDTLQKVKDAASKYFTSSVDSKTGKPRGFLAKIVNDLDEYKGTKLLNAAWSLYSHGDAVEETVDKIATSDKLNEMAKEKDVQEWLLPQIEDMFGEAGIRNGIDAYTSTGNYKSFNQLHDAYNAENIVKNMKRKQEQRGLGLMNIYISATSLQAVASKEYKNISEMHHDAGKLSKVSEEDYSQKVSAVDKQIEETIDSIVSDDGSSKWEIMDGITNSWLYAAQRKQTVDAVKSAFKRNMIKVSDDTAQKILDANKAAAELPTEYFEAKPGRVIPFSESVAAVIPSNSSQKLKDKLTKKGIRYEEYKAGNQEDKLSLINQIADENPEKEAKFSAEDSNAAMKSLMQENKRLRAQVERIKQDNTVTKVPTLKRSSVTQIAKQLKRDFYGKNIDTEELTDSLMEIGDILMTDVKKNGADSDTYGKMQEKANILARQIVSEAVMKDTSLEEEYGEAVNAIRDTTFTITAKEAAEITDRADFRKRNGKNIHYKIVPAGETAKWDVQLDALADAYPGTVPFSGEVGARTPEELFSTLEEFFGNYGKDISPFTGEASVYTGMDTAMAVDAVSQQIMDSILFDATELHTKADRAKAKTDAKVNSLKQKLTDTKAEAKEREKAAYTAGAMKQGMKERESARKAYQKQTEMAQRLIESTKSKYEQKISAEKQAHKAAVETMRYNRNRSEAEKTLMKLVKRVGNSKLSTPNRAYFEQFFGDIDTVARSLTTKRENKVADLEWEYNQRKKNDPDFIGSASIEQFFKDFHDKNRRISEMTDQEIADYITMLREFEHTVAYQNKLIGIEDRRNTAEMAVKIISDVEKSAGTGEHNIADIVVADNALDPMREIRRVTGYDDSDPMYRAMNELNEGNHKADAYWLNSQKPLSRFTNNTKFMKHFDGRKADEIEITGRDTDGREKKVKVTPSMRASIYLHSLADDNLRHMATGGIKIPDIVEYKKGNKKEAFAHGTRLILSPSEAAKIVADMPAEEKEFARLVDNYFTNVSRPALAETREQLTGVPGKFVKGHYYPIRSDSNYTNKDISNGNFMANMDPSISNPNWLKERTVEAKNPMLLFSVVDVFNQSVRNHADYIGLAIPLRDFDKLYTAKTGVAIEDGKDAGAWNPYGNSVKEAIESKWSTRATKNIDTFIDQLKGVDMNGGSMKLLDSIRGNSAQGNLSLNASVGIKQTASFFTAGSEVSGGSLAKAMNPALKANTDFIDKMTPVFLLRKQGWNTTEMGDLSKNTNDLAKVLSKPVLNWITDMDLGTTALLKRAAYFEAKKLNPNLSTESMAFKQKATELYNRIIENTQPNYNILHRASVLRSKDSLTKILNMYKTQPYQNMNILYDALGEFKQRRQDYKAGAASKEEVNASGNRLYRAVSSQLISSFVFALMQFAWDKFRDKDDKYEDKDGNQTLLSWLKGMGMNMAGNAFGMAPYLSFVPDIFEVITDKVMKRIGKDEVFDATFYGYEVSPVEAINDTIKAGISAFDDIVQFIVDAADPEKEADAEALIRGLYDGIETTAPYIGLPLANVRKELQYLTRIVMKKAEGEYIGQYDYLKLTGGSDSDKYNLLWSAYSKGSKDFEELYSRMIADGYDADKIADRMDSKIKMAEGVTKTGQMATRFIDPGDNETYQRYDDTMRAVTSSDLFKQSTEAKQESARDSVYDIIVDQEDSTGQKVRDMLETAPEGVDETTYVLYKLALAMVDQPDGESGHGSYDMDEVKAAIDKLDLDNKQQKSFMWETVSGKSTKNNPYS